MCLAGLAVTTGTSEVFGSKSVAQASCRLGEPTKRRHGVCLFAEFAHGSPGTPAREPQVWE
ncbi:hypothetical protein RW1_031_00540 [Rhodococcus wratislaviensis NBRC 100605]|uniref:Uncharacterized protein n=1 Tax=Rhodococcus wratislaviensis NBRC 100605 TaxID=1219028 RepID=X0R6C2_RHOWR|nr:hypothetical protein RW1_031_00540 [Rhodococcus wratislaviensis NBRC 100605]